MTDELPEHIWISGGPGKFPYAHMPLSNPEDKALGTKYVRADKYEALLQRLNDMEYALLDGHLDKVPAPADVLKVWIHYVKTGEGRWKQKEADDESRST